MRRVGTKAKKEKVVEKPPEVPEVLSQEVGIPPDVPKPLEEGPWDPSSVDRKQALTEVVEIFGAEKSSEVFQWVWGNLLFYESSEKGDPILHPMGKSVADQFVTLSPEALKKARDILDKAFLNRPKPNTKEIKTVKTQDKDQVVLTRVRRGKNYQVRFSLQDYEDLEASYGGDPKKLQGYLYQLGMRYSPPFSLKAPQPLPQGYYEYLFALGAKYQAISTPLTYQLEFWGSIFPDLDQYFAVKSKDSRGDIFRDLEAREKVYKGTFGEILEVNLSGYGWLTEPLLKKLFLGLPERFTIFATIDPTISLEELPSYQEIQEVPDGRRIVLWGQVPKEHDSDRLRASLVEKTEESPEEKVVEPEKAKKTRKAPAPKKEPKETAPKKVPRGGRQRKTKGDNWQPPKVVEVTTEVDEGLEIFEGQHEIPKALQDVLDRDTTLIPPMEDETGRITVPVMTKYEKAKLIGFRAEQLAKNYPPLFEPEDEIALDMVTIAARELIEYPEQFPLKVLRPLPDGKVEEYRVSQLEDVPWI